MIDLEAQILQFMEQQIPFNRFLGLRIDSLATGFARMRLPFRDELIGDPFRPAIHGGVLCTLIDTCGGAAVYTQIKKGDSISTVDLRVDFLRPGPSAALLCEARVVRIGNRVGVADMQVFPVDDAAHVVATGKAVYNIRRTRSARD